MQIQDRNITELARKLGQADISAQQPGVLTWVNEDIGATVNQGDVLATAVPGFPVWDLGGLLGSTLWGLWVLALGVAALRAPIRRPTSNPAVTNPIGCNVKWRGQPEKWMPPEACDLV